MLLSWLFVLFWLSLLILLVLLLSLNKYFVGSVAGWWDKVALFFLLLLFNNNNIVLIFRWLLRLLIFLSLLLLLLKKYFIGRVAGWWDEAALAQTSIWFPDWDHSLRTHQQVISMGWIYDCYAVYYDTFYAFFSFLADPDWIWDLFSILESFCNC